jgi:hypothetical protein
MMPYPDDLAVPAADVNMAPPVVRDLDHFLGTEMWVDEVEPVDPYLPPPDTK